MDMNGNFILLAHLSLVLMHQHGMVLLMLDMVVICFRNGGKHVNQISKWGDSGNAEWTVDVFEPGYYYLDLRYRGDGRLVWKTITDEGVMVQNQQAATEKYQNYAMGILEFKKAGKHNITVSLVEGNRESSSLESMIIYPAK